jgi:hypothetical protein
LSDFEGGEVAVVDAVFEGVGVDWVAEVGVGIGVVDAFWGGGEAKLYDDDEVEEVEEVGGIVAEVEGDGLSCGFDFAQPAIIFFRRVYC